MKAQHDIQAIFIDYLQLLHGTSKRSRDNRQLEISEISSGLKELAKELGISVVVLAQLNRMPDQRGPASRPRLSDLRESGSIEQDADTVGFIRQPWMQTDDEDERQAIMGQAELIIAKQRNGPIGDVPLTFIREFTRFETRAESEETEPTPKQSKEP
jgi:replicative DNA helicase